MINFIKFSEQCLPVVQKVRKKAEEMAQENESLIREHARLETQLTQLQYDRLAIYRARVLDIVFFFKRKAESRRTQGRSLNQRERGSQRGATIAKGPTTRVTARDRGSETGEGRFGSEKGLKREPNYCWSTHGRFGHAEKPRY